MELSLAQLALVIELNEKEIRSLKRVIDSPDATDEEVDDAGELVMQYLALSSSLATIYKERWSSGSNLPEYEELVGGLEDE